MKFLPTRSLIPVLILFILVSDHAHAAMPLTKVLMTTGSLSEREGALYVAQDQGFFRKHGLDLTLVQVRNGPVGMSALSSGESLLHWGSVSGANLGAISEGADLVFIAGFINKLSGTFVANPKIKSPAELKGKSLGVNSLSGGAWIFTVLTLDHWGLVPSGTKYKSGRSETIQWSPRPSWPEMSTQATWAIRSARSCRARASACWLI